MPTSYTWTGDTISFVPLRPAAEFRANVAIDHDEAKNFIDNAQLGDEVWFYPRNGGYTLEITKYKYIGRDGWQRYGDAYRTETDRMMFIYLTSGSNSPELHPTSNIIDNLEAYDAPQDQQEGSG